MARASSPAPTRTVFLLHGEDPFRIRLRASELVEQLLAGVDTDPGELSLRPQSPYGAALGLARVDARDDGAAETVLIAGQSQGLFAAPDERRVVLVEHAESLERLEVVGRFPPDASLVLVAPEPVRPARVRSRGRVKDARGGASGLLEAVAEAGGRAERIDRPVGEEITRWITARAKVHGVELRPDAVAALAFAVGADTERIESEIRKLGAWANGAAVAADQVRELVAGAIESDVFELTKAVVRRDVHGAVRLLDRLLREGNAPQQLLALLLWQFRVLLFASRSPTAGQASDMAKAIRSSPGAILRYVQYARGLGPSDILRAYEALYACDVSIKTGRAEPDEAALMLCVLDLCGVAGADYRDFLLRESPRR